MEDRLKAYRETVAALLLASPAQQALVMGSAPFLIGSGPEEESEDERTPRKKKRQMSEEDLRTYGQMVNSLLM